MALGVADLDDQDAVVGQVVTRLAQNSTHDIQAIVTGAQRQRRLMAEFLRHVGEIEGIHVGRIGDDQVIALARHTREQVRLHGDDTPCHVVTFDVATRDFQRLAADIDQVDLGGRHHQRGGDTDAAGTGAHVQHASRRQFREPGREAALDQLGDRRARNQHTLIDIEGHAGEEGLAEQIRQRLAGGDALTHQRHDARSLHGQKARVDHGGVRVPRQMQRTQHQRHRFVPGRIGAMGEVQAMRVELTGRPADQVAQGHQLLDETGVRLTEAGRMAQVGRGRCGHGDSCKRTDGQRAPPVVRGRWRLAQAL